MNLRPYKYSILLSIAALLIWFVPGASDFLSYDRHAIASGQLWRLITGHFTHWTLDQLVWNVAAFGVLGGLRERQGRRGFLFCLALATPTISVAVWLGLPHFETYRGLSGLSSALFALTGARLLEEKLREREWAWTAAIMLIAIGFALKIGFEAIHHATIFVQNDGAMVPLALAHIVGAGAGIITFILIQKKDGGLGEECNGLA